MPDFGFDQWLDAQLRGVPVPPDFLARLKASRPLSDDELDSLVRHVSVPEHLERRLRRIARHRRPRLILGRLALAASVLLIVAAGAYVALVRTAGPAADAKVANAQPRQVPDPRTLAARSDHAQRPAQAPRRQEPVTVPLGRSGEQASQPIEPSAEQPENVARAASSVKQAIESKLKTVALGAGGTLEPLPELQAFESPLARGIVPPRVKGYDLLFQLRYHEHPFVSPAAHEQLRAVRVPLTFRTSSYDLAVARIEAGQLPGHDEIRVEDFLAAQHYLLPAPPRAPVALYAAAGPSPLGEPGRHLLQLVAQGGQRPIPRRQPGRLVAVVDTSAAMRFGGRFSAVLRAFEDFERHMSPADRLTLIGFAAGPRVLAADASRDELDELLASGGLRQTGGSADFASAAQAAFDAVAAIGTTQPPQVVFVTAASADVDDAQLARARESLLQLAASGVAWQVVRVLPTDDEARWSDLARDAQGRARAVTSGSELCASLVERLTGQSRTVAEGVSLVVTFNPRVVTSYRLLGHESATLTGDAGDPLVVDLTAEQTATGMFELWLKPAAKGEIARVELAWRDPRGQPQRIERVVARNEVAGSFSAAPSWLQQGIVAVSAAELLRASYYVPRSRRLGQLLDLVSDVDQDAAKMPEFQALVRLIETADGLR